MRVLAPSSASAAAAAAVFLLATSTHAFSSVPQPQISWLFSTTGKVTFTEQSIKFDALDQTLMFSDRPNRLSRVISPEDLVGIIAHMDDQDPPNAVLSVTAADGEVYSAVVELTKAVDNADGSVSCSYRNVGEVEDALGNLAKLESCVGCPAGIFIDNAHYTHYTPAEIRRGCASGALLCNLNGVPSCELPSCERPSCVPCVPSS